MIEGEIFDVGVDIRRGSPTFLHWVVTTLSAQNFRQCYIPSGFAHDFCVTKTAAQIEYKCTDFYDPADEIHVRWDDPDIDISGLWMTLSYRRRIVRPLTCAMILSGYLPSNSAPNEDSLNWCQRPTWPSPPDGSKTPPRGGACSDQIDIAQLDQVLAAAAISWASLDDQCRGLQRC